MNPAASTNQQKYESGSKILQLLIARFQRRVCDLLGPLEFRRVIDVGCGEGFLSRVLLDRFPGIEVVGVDLSPTAVAAAAARCPEGRFSVTTAEELDRLGERFDLVVCSEVLEHVQDPRVALAGLSRLAPQALLTVPWEPWFQLANLARGKYLPTLGNHPEHIHRWTMRGFATLAASNYEQVHAETMFPWTIYLGRAR